MIAGEGWHNQTGERAAEEFIPWFYLIKSFSLLSCMPTGRWGGQSLANRQLRYGCRDPSAVGTILSRFPEQHTARLHTAKLPLNQSGLFSFVCNRCVTLVHLCVSDNTPATLSNTSLPCLTLIWTQDVLSTDVKQLKWRHIGSHAPPRWEASCQCS